MISDPQLSWGHLQQPRPASDRISLPKIEGVAPCVRGVNDPDRRPGKRYRFGPHRPTAAVLVCAAMGELNSPETPSLELRIGRLLFALSVVASGIYQLLTGRYVNLVPANPARLPPPWQPYLFGVLFVLIGVALLMRKTVSVAAITLAALLLALF